MYMTEDFIQTRYDLLGGTSARFYYNDKIVMNLIEQVQRVSSRLLIRLDRDLAF